MISVLIIDDEPVIRRSLQRFFEANNAQVFLAENGQQGFELWIEKKPQIIILDLLMPQMTGLEVLLKIRDIQNSNLHHLGPFQAYLMSAHPEDLVPMDRDRLFIKGFLRKPFVQVQSMVEDILQSALALK